MAASSTGPSGGQQRLIQGNSVIVRGPGLNTPANGNYLLRIMASQVVAVTGGASMEQDTTFGDSTVDKFFRKFGDHDGDNAVGLLDFASFRRTFGLAAGDANFFGDLDSDGDEIISLVDFAQFRRDFGT